MAPCGRPLTPLDPAAGAAAALGAEVRQRRLKDNLTLAALSALCGYSSQHLSELERGKASVTRRCILALEGALGAHGALLGLLAPAMTERALAAQERAAARRGATIDDVDPTNRRGLIGMGAASAVALGAAGVAAAPAAAREVDPELPAHLLALLGSHDALCGPHDVLSVAYRELGRIAEYREAATGQLRTELMRVEARWTVYTAWLANGTGDTRGRDALLERALQLARESDCPDVMAWARARQAQCSVPPTALRLAEVGMRTPRAGAQTRALCTVRAAYAYARIGDGESAVRAIADAEALLAQDSPPPPDAAIPSADRLVRCWEARCWSTLKPARGVALYEGVLRDWPRRQVKDDGLYRARLALACAGAGELDRARAEGRRALAITRQTRSNVAARELRQLGAVLNAV